MNRIFETPLYPYAPLAARHAPVAIIGAGPVGLALAIDLAQQGIPVTVLDDNDRVSSGSRAICFAKRTLEICDRLGLGEACVAKGVTWNRGRVFFGEGQVYAFDLQPEDGHRRPAFVNLQQYHFEKYLVDRVRALQAEGRPITLAGRHRVTHVAPEAGGVRLAIDTPEGPTSLDADWLVACDGAGSPTRTLLGLDFAGRVFEDNFLIADVVMAADFPTERWFWFDPPFNRGQSALLHKQPDGVWRIDLQLGQNIDREAEKAPARVIPRLKAMLGEVDFTLEWVSIYTFQCRRMARFRHGRVLFAGDSAHQVSPFGARGANSGLQDAENLAWKLAMVARGEAPEALLDSYDAERIAAADENILNSTRSTDFITPKSPVSRLYRDAVLSLAARAPFARPLVNSGRLSVPATYESPLSTPDALPGAPAASRPGAPCPDAPLPDGGWLLDRLGGRFTVMGLGTPAPDLTLPATGALARRYLGDAPQGVYLVRPDQHVAARWPAHDAASVARAIEKATARC